MFVGAFAAFVPGDIVGDMTSIGTLFAFIIVCAGVWIMRKKHPELPRDFKTPLVPLFPILGIVVCAAMIVGLGWTNWLRLARLAGDRPGDLRRSTAASTPSCGPASHVNVGGGGPVTVGERPPPSP